MSLSNAIKTHILDPRVHNDRRSEFRLDDGFYSSNLTLVDAGLYDTALTDDTNVTYPCNAGAMSCIKNIYLYSDNVAIDQLLECQSHSAFKCWQSRNARQNDLNRFDLYSGWGFNVADRDVTIDGEDQKKNSYTLQAEYVDYYLQQGNTQSFNQPQVARAEASGISGQIRLSEYLGFLRDSKVLPRIPNLRLVIEWNTTATDTYTNSNATTPAPVKSFKVKRPSLICDEILGMSGEQDFKIPYYSTIHERFVVDAVAEGSTQRASLKSTAFNQRWVKDIMFFNRASGDSDYMLAKFRSPAQKDEKLQLIVNGTKFLPDQGIDTPGLKVYHLNNSHGTFNLPQACYQYATADAPGRYISARSKEIVGQGSITSVAVEDKIERLQVEYERVGYSADAGADTRASFELFCYGRIAKLLEVKKGRSRVSY